MHFATLRLIIFTLTALAQGYLIVRCWRVIQLVCRSNRCKVPAIVLVATVIVCLFLMNEYLMVRSVPWVDPPLAPRVILFSLPAVWSFGSIFSALLLFLARVAGRLWRLAVQLCRSLSSQTQANPVDLGRRRFLQAGMGGLAAAPLLISGYGAAYAAKDYAVSELTLPFGRSLRVVQLTDIHAGLYMTRSDMRRYADQVIALQPDLFVLTGDYISNSMVFLPGCLEEMARVRARYGTVATLGNHEHWYGELREIRKTFRQYRIPLLINQHQVIGTEQGPFAVVGIDDLRAGRPDLEAALRGLGPGIPKLLLSHHPEVFPEAAAHGIPLTLSGHYHGGQIKLSLPGIKLSMAHAWTPYPEGLYRLNSSHLYVGRGIGTTFIPIRLNAPPEVALFHLT
jgi:predicted MPP superfamily phosphohydrolase